MFTTLWHGILFFLLSIFCSLHHIYVASRLYTTLNLVYVPLYLDERVNNQHTENLRESLASVPLVSFISSFITSIILKTNTERWGNKTVYLIGSLISMCSCLLIGFYLDQNSTIMIVYIVAVLIGAGSSITLVSSLCLTATLIGSNVNQGASVYSIVTFTDKLICGVVVVIIENIKCSDKSMCPEYYRYVLAYVSAGAVISGIIVLVTLPKLSRQILHS